MAVSECGAGEQLDQLRGRRNYHFRAYRSARRLIQENGLEHPLGNLWADMYEWHEARYQELDEQISSTKESDGDKAA